MLFRSVVVRLSVELATFRRFYVRSAGSLRADAARRDILPADEKKLGRRYVDRAAAFPRRPSAPDVVHVCTLSQPVWTRTTQFAGEEEHMSDVNNFTRTRAVSTQ